MKNELFSRKKACGGTYWAVKGETNQMWIDMTIAIQNTAKIVLQELKRKVSIKKTLGGRMKRYGEKKPKLKELAIGL